MTTDWGFVWNGDWVAAGVFATISVIACARFPWRAPARRWALVRAWLVVLTALLVSSVLTSLVAAAVTSAGFLSKGRFSGTGDSVVLFAISGTFAVSIVAGTTVAALHVRDWRRFLGLRVPGIRETLIWLAVGLFVSILRQSLSACLGLRVLAVRSAHLVDTASNLWLFFVAVSILGTFVEELLYRGVLLGPVRASPIRSTATALGLVFSAACWAWSHPVLGVEALLLMGEGVVLGIARLRTGSVWIPWVMHAASNASVTAALLIQDR